MESDLFFPVAPRHSLTACVPQRRCFPHYRSAECWCLLSTSSLWIFTLGGGVGGGGGALLAGAGDAPATRLSLPGLQLSWLSSQMSMALGHLCFLLTRRGPGKQCHNQLCLQILAQTMANKLCPVFSNLDSSCRSRDWSGGLRCFPSQLTC